MVDHIYLIFFSSHDPLEKSMTGRWGQNHTANEIIAKFESFVPVEPQLVRMCDSWESALVP